MKIASLVVLSLIVALLLVGCGSSSKTDMPSISLLSEPSLDGQVTATSVSTDQSPTVTDGLPQAAIIGDNASNQGMRAVVSFDISAVPTNAIVDSATLMIYQANEVDANAAVNPAVAQVTFKGHPYDSATDTTNPGLGPVVVDHIYYGNTLTTAAYDMAGLTSEVPNSLATSWAIGFRQVDVTAAVVDDLANRATRSHSQFRIRHEAVTNNNNAEDSDGWTMGEGQGTALNHKPGLVIVYHLPTGDL